MEPNQRVNSDERAHNNNFGALRLLFAYLVIVAHSPELIDGNRSREWLTEIFGTISFGTFAVYGFFLISGYLITKSFETSPQIDAYLRKRAYRIVPGFLVAFVFCLFVVGPIGGGNTSAFLSPYFWAANFKRVILLQDPYFPEVFEGSFYATLNGSMWTLGYECRCYLIVLIFGALFGLRRRRNWVGATTFLLIVASAAFSSTIRGDSRFAAVIGEPELDLQLTAVFAAGSSYYLFREVIPFRRDFVLFAILALIFCLYSPNLATPGVAVFGGYLIFWCALVVQSKTLGQIGRRTDISYGVYLYAFPIQKIVIMLLPAAAPFCVTLLATAFTLPIAWLSWTVVEKPLLRLAK